MNTHAARPPANSSIRAMTRVFLSLVILGMTTSCSRGNDSRSSAEAARADSSAAGYAVGIRVDSSNVTDGPQSAVSMVPSAPNGTGSTTRRMPSVALSIPPNAAEATNRTTLATASAHNRRDAATTMKDSARSGSAKRPPNGTTMRTSGDSSGRADVSTGPVRVNEFLAYDSRSKIVSLQLIAGYNGLNGSLNYNGATNGTHGIFVPVGWRIHVAVTNRDSDLQHSAIVVRELLPPPVEPSEPAFSGAALSQLSEGLHEAETSSLDFVADRAGHYMIVCGVPGHAQAGMWLKLSVTADIPIPVYR